jgi:hypothetical protein
VRKPVDDKPTDGIAVRTYGDMFGCVMHPAFRLGFLDALAGRGFDHDRIVDRIYAETPEGALGRLGWTGMFYKPNVALAQYRYEEGRKMVVEKGLKCRAWGHPDFPPRSVCDWIWANGKPDKVAA